MRGAAEKIAILLLLGVFALVAGCSESVTDPDRGSVARESFYYRFQVSEQVLIAVSGVSGDITVTGSAWSDSIVVKGEKRVTSYSADDALEYLDSLTVTVVNEAGVVSAETDQPGESDGRQYEVEYEVTIPTDIAVSTSNVNGIITIDSVAKPITASNVNGTVSLSDIVASVTGSVVNGRIEGDVTLPLHAIVSMSVVNGEIDVEVPAATSAIFSASYVNGSVYTPNLPLQDVESSPGSLTGRLGDGEGTIALSVVNGSITARGF
jgi:hypothetical protein